MVMIAMGMWSWTLVGAIFMNIKAAEFWFRIIDGDTA